MELIVQLLDRSGGMGYAYLPSLCERRDPEYINCSRRILRQLLRACFNLCRRTIDSLSAVVSKHCLDRLPIIITRNPP